MAVGQARKLFDFPESKRTPSGRKRPDGIATSDLVFSAYVGNNADIFPHVLKLHVAAGAKIADVTYGKGVFWKKVDTSEYQIFPSDIADGIDCRSLPYADGSFDVVVFDPPVHGRLLPQRGCGEGRRWDAHHVQRSLLQR